jgi:hypothetical protein
MLVRLFLAFSLFVLPALAADAPDQTVVSSQVSEGLENPIFRTTSTVWKTNRRRVIDDDKSIELTTNNLLTVAAPIAAMDAMTGLVTVPFDLVAAAFRRAKRVQTFKIEGRLVDAKAKARPSVPLTLTAQILDASGLPLPERNEVVGAVTGSDGSFSANVSLHREKGEKAQIFVESTAPDGKKTVERKIPVP